MLPSGKRVNEYGSISQELKNITLFDLVKKFNNESENDIKLDNILDLIAQHLGYCDVYDMEQKNQFNVLTPDRARFYHLDNAISKVYSTLDKLAKLYGYKDHYDMEYNLETATERLSPINITNDLIRIDRQGRVWVNGKVEQNPTKIGKEILKISQEYRDNLAISDFKDYFNDLDKENEKTYSEKAENYANMERYSQQSLYDELVNLQVRPQKSEFDDDLPF